MFLVYLIFFIVRFGFVLRWFVFPYIIFTDRFTLLSIEIEIYRCFMHKIHCIIPSVRRVPRIVTMEHT